MNNVQREEKTSWLLNIIYNITGPTLAIVTAIKVKVKHFSLFINSSISKFIHLAVQASETFC